jgi:GGDEF domain-containing protein
LESFSDRLSRHLRQADSIFRLSIADSDSISARLGGDEFTILLSEIDTIQDSAKISIRILDMLSEPFVLGTHEIFMPTSIGYPFIHTMGRIVIPSLN